MRMTSGLTSSELTFDTVEANGLPAFLNVYHRGEFAARFYFNMRGYVQSFQLRNAEGVGFDLGERGGTTQIRQLKRAIKDGFTTIITFD